MFLQNVAQLPVDYVMSYPIRWNSSKWDQVCLIYNWSCVTVMWFKCSDDIIIVRN
jgi:hypothetical protein